MSAAASLYRILHMLATTCSLPAVLLRDPDLIKNVIIKDFASFEETTMHVVDLLLAPNPIACVREKWNFLDSFLSG